MALLVHFSSNVSSKVANMCDFQHVMKMQQFNFFKKITLSAETISMLLSHRLTLTKHCLSHYSGIICIFLIKALSI